MSFWKRLRSGNFLLKLTVSLFSLLLLSLVIFLQIDNYIFKHRAERLIADFAQLNAMDTYGNTKPFLAKWEWLIGKVQGCEENECHIYFSLGSYGPQYLRSFTTKHPGLLAPIWRFYLGLGGRPGLINGWITIRRGRIVSRTLQIWVVSMPEGRADRFIVGEIQTIDFNDKYGRDWPRDPESVTPQTILHSEYVLMNSAFRSIAHQDYMEAARVWVQFTPYANPEDVRRLSQVNLDCFSGWHVCRSTDELLPAVVAQYKLESATIQTLLQSHKCSPEDIVHFGRNAQNIAIAKLVNMSGNPQDKDSSVLAFQLIKLVKRAKFWKSGTTLDTVAFHWAIYGVNSSKPEFKIGNPYLLLFNRSQPGPHAIWLYPCGLIPYDEDNLKLVQKGIEQDIRSRDSP